MKYAVASGERQSWNIVLRISSRFDCVIYVSESLFRHAIKLLSVGEWLCDDNMQNTSTTDSGTFYFAFSNRLVAAADLNLWIIRITLIPYGDSQRI